MKNFSQSALCLVFFLAVCCLPSQAQAKQITVGGKNFTEQYILAEMAKILLEKAGFDVSLRTGVGSVVLRQSLERGQVDLCLEYTGTAYTVYHRGEDRAVMTDPEQVFTEVKAADAQRGLVWLSPIREVNTTYTLMMQKERAEALNIGTISDLAAYVNRQPRSLIFGMNAEFWGRPDGFQGLMRTYRFRVPPGNVKRMATGLTYLALRQGETDVSMGFSTDGRIAAWGFVNLEDDQNFFPVYNPVPVVREKILEKYPEIAQILRPMSQLSTRDMQELNKAVDVDKKSVPQATRQWLKSRGLI